MDPITFSIIRHRLFRVVDEAVITLVETPETAGITNFLHRVMVRGTARHSAVGLTEAVEDIGGSLDASGDVEYGEVRGTAQHGPGRAGR